MKKVREFKLCRGCNQIKHRDEFHKCTLRSGKEGRQAKCKECNKNMSQLPEEKERLRIASKRHKEKIRNKIRNIKESSPCKDCGNKYPYYVMQFDHTSDDKCFNIAGAVGIINQNKIYKEIEKCDLVCGNCHAIRTHNRRLQQNAK